MSSWSSLSLLSDLHDRLSNASEEVAHSVQCGLLHGLLSLLDQCILDFLDIFVA